jgi:hypothetical protein
VFKRGDRLGSPTEMTLRSRSNLSLTFIAMKAFECLEQQKDIARADVA